MIDKSESVYWANVWWILGADHLTFESLWVIQKKSILQTDFEGKQYMHQKKLLLMTYNAEKKKILHRYMSGKNF